MSGADPYLAPDYTPDSRDLPKRAQAAARIAEVLYEPRRLDEFLDRTDDQRLDDPRRGQATELNRNLR